MQENTNEKTELDLVLEYLELKQKYYKKYHDTYKNERDLLFSTVLAAEITNLKNNKHRQSNLSIYYFMNT